MNSCSGLSNAGFSMGWPPNGNRDGWSFFLVTGEASFSRDFAFMRGAVLSAAGATRETRSP
jgi:hypothetical protein